MRQMVVFTGVNARRNARTLLTKINNALGYPQGKTLYWHEDAIELSATPPVYGVYSLPRVENELSAANKASRIDMAQARRDGWFGPPKDRP